MYEHYEQDPHAQRWMDVVDALNNRITRLQRAIDERNARIGELEDYIRTLSTPFSQIKEWIDQRNVADIEKRPTGRALLKGKKILVIGSCACRPKELLGFAKLYGFTKDDFTFVSDYVRIKNREIPIWNDRIAAMIVGPVPHNVKNIDIDLLKFITDYQDTIPVMVCKNGKGHIKISKQAFKEALQGLIYELKISY